RPPEIPLTSDSKGSQRSLRGGTARRCCPRRAGQTAQSGSSPLPKTAGGERGGSPSQPALPVAYPAGFLSHPCSFHCDDEPEILPSSTHPICLIGADAGQARIGISPCNDGRLMFYRLEFQAITRLKSQTVTSHEWRFCVSPRRRCRRHLY